MIDPRENSPSAGSGDTGRHAVGLEAVDVRRIESMCAPLRSMDTRALLTGLFDGVDDAPALVELVARYCILDHAALLVAVDDFDAALAGLPALGLEPALSVPSVIVKARLSERYGVDPTLLDVRLTHAALISDAGMDRTLEIFMVRRTADLPAGLLERERALELERHFAMRLPDPDPVIIEGLRQVLRTRAAFDWDGGGYNPHDKADAGGTSVLYFLRLVPDRGEGVRSERLEVKFLGDFSSITTTHVASGAASMTKGDGVNAKRRGFAVA